MADYDRLGALDETFLYLESAETPMHLAAVAIFEREPLYGADGRFRLDDVRALVTSRLPLIPRFRRKIAYVPFGLGRPVWVDDADFDVSRHVKVTSLPPPGTRQQLVALAERLNEQVLDREHPLWEVWFVEGLDRGQRLGLLYKSHHALTDGISLVDIATAMLDGGAEPTIVDPPLWHADPAPDPARLMLDSLRDRVHTPIELASLARRVVRAPREAVERVVHVARSVATLFENGLIAPILSVNAPIGRGRRIATVRIPLDLVRRVRKQYDCTVNDAILAGVGGGVARLLEMRGELREGLSVKVFCPVSVREEEQRTQLGNRISAIFVPLVVGEPDPLARLDAVRAATAHLKQRDQAIGPSTLIGLSEYAAPALLALAARAAHGQRFANLMVTNIPGPQVPLYCLGAQMLEVYPLVPLSRNLTINVAVLSYCGQLHFGIIGDGDAAPDLEVLAGGIEDAFEELFALSLV
jgi:WS/DGAT/MGAT family acyltransferase